MIWVNVKRALKTGFVQFWRNGVVSLSAVSVMIITLFFISGVIFSHSLLTGALEEIKEKVDVNVYFEVDASEEQVFEVQKVLDAMPEVAFVEYVSRDQALENFVDTHKNQQDIIAALEELNDNPFGATLNVKAVETQQYESVANFLKDNYPQDGTSIVSQVNYFRNKDAIDTLSNIIDAGQTLGLFLTIVFIIVSIIITFNTIRLAMYISRDEISVMRLVGASHNYISGPFVVTGAMYGVVASILTLILLWPITYWLGPITERFFGNMSVFEYYINSFGEIFLVILSSGVLIGSVSSFLAIKKYLRDKKR